MPKKKSASGAFGDTVLFLVSRSGETFFVTLKIE
jgi:hypothetical protein